MAPKSKLTLFVIIFLIITASCAIFYSNSLNNPFIWDDDGLITRNPIIQSFANFPRIFSSDLYFGTASGSNFYRPMQSISYMLDYHFWQLDTLGYHITNILLQALVAFLVFLFSSAVLKNRRVAFAAALLFALNPLHTEAVTYISGRAEMLMGIFLLSSLLLFMRGFSVLSWLCFIFGLLSKELAVVFPLVILSYLFCYKREERKSPSGFLKLALPFFIIAALYLFLRVFLLNFATIRPPALTKYPLILRITVLPKVIFTYFKLLLLPVNLHMSWTLRRPVTFCGIFLSWFSLGVIYAACIRIFKYGKENKPLAFMLSWSLIFFLPQSGILPINAFLAEHFIYLSSISFFMLAAFLLNKYLRKELFIFSVIGLALFYGLLTYSRNFDWQDPIRFYSKIIKFSPESFQAHNNLGLQYEYRYQYDLAIVEYKKALEIEPELIEARSNLANVYFKINKFKEAKEEYAKVENSALTSKLGELENNIGCIYEVEGLFDQAMEHYARALQLDPSLNFPHFNIAKIYMIKGDMGNASREVLKSLPEISPMDVNRNKYLAIITDYIKLVKNSRYAVTFYNDLGIRFASGNFFDASIASFKRVLELDPRYADAHFNLGLSYWKKGLKREAVFEFKTALKINPNHLKAKGFLTEIIYKK